MMNASFCPESCKTVLATWTAHGTVTSGGADQDKSRSAIIALGIEPPDGVAGKTNKQRARSRDGDLRRPRVASCHLKERKE